MKIKLTTEKHFLLIELKVGTIFYFVAIFDKTEKRYKIWLHKIDDKILYCF